VLVLAPRGNDLLMLRFKEIHMEIKLTAAFRKFPEGYAAFVEDTMCSRLTLASSPSHNSLPSNGEELL
jgi:hypothetical protein